MLLPEAEARLQQYHALLLKWQKKINLVSPTTIDTAWRRHFEDSLQLLPYIPEGATLMDWGSGAGFPGLVLALARPDLKVTLVESDTRKTAFLKNVSRETSLPVATQNDRIEEIPAYGVDVISARALASLETLCGWALPWFDKNPRLIMLLMKGAAVQDEIEAAKKSYDFNVDFIPAVQSDGMILRVSNVKKLDF